MKNHSLFLIILTTFFVVHFFESCSKSQPSIPDTGYATHEVYIAGTYQNDTTSTEKAAYWKNGVMTLLSDINSNATGIYVEGADVYVSGNLYSIGSRNVKTYFGYYWKNGVSFRLASAFPNSNSSLTAGNIFVSNGDIYIAGVDNLHATIWKNGIPRTLDTSILGSSASSVFVSGNDVYVTGLVWKRTSCCDIRIATLWKNGVPVSLGLGDSNALCVFVNGTDVYVGGSDSPPPGSNAIATMYWKNGIPIKLDSIYATQVNSLWVDGNDVYALGNNTLWKNGTAINLHQGAGTNCMSIVAKNGELFIAGAAPPSAPYNTSHNMITYWHNSSVFSIPYYGYVTAMFVK